MEKEFDSAAYCLKTGQFFLTVGVILLSSCMISCEKSWNCDVKISKKLFTCGCTNGSQWLEVDCSNKGLHNIPICTSFPQLTTHLILRKNNIHTVADGPFSCLTELKYLDLSENIIKYLFNDSFIGLNALQKLNLGFNGIPLDEFAYPDDVFRPLQKLENLYLKGNCFKVKCKKYPDRAFGKLTSLKSLHGDPLLEVRFGEGFRNLIVLNELDLSGFHDMPGIATIHNTSFVNLEGLPISSLNLSESHTSYIEAFSFTVLKNLNILDLTNCDLGARLEEAFIGLNKTAINTLILNQTSINVVDDSIIRSLVGTNISRITFTNNGITTVLPVFSKYLPHLESVSLELNHITGKLSALGNLLSISSMKYINISRQNTIRGVDHIIESDAFAVNTPYFLLPIKPNFETFDFSYNGLRIDEIPGIVFPQNTHLKHMILSNNRIERFAGPFRCVPKYKMKLELFDISMNGCNEIPIDIFAYCDWSQMRELILSDNNLGYLFDSDKASGFLSQMHGLETFAMERNMIKTLKRDQFIMNKQLRNILLSGNGIIDFNMHIEHLSDLRILNLSNNLIHFLPITVLNALSKISKNHTVTIDLSGNPLECSCDKTSLDFLNWMYNNYNLLETRSHVCRFSNNTKMNLTRGGLEHIIKWMKIECTSNTLTIAISVASSVLAVIVICGSIIFRYRWRLTFWWYTHGQKYKPLNDHDYPYDVFVSYSDELDSMWVIRNLIPCLEGEKRLRLCIHTRDFEVGKPIADNIIDCLHMSRKVLLVLSKDFLESSWCRFEAQMAYHMMVKRETDIILLVIRSQLPIDLLTGSLVELIEKRTYIEWPSDPAGQDAFWARLYVAIQS